MSETAFNPPVLVDASGRPARKVSASCPQCGKGPDVRVASGGFGARHPVCPCGHEFFDEAWRG